MHDPFAMRPFFGYNFGQYLSHWLKLADHPGAKLPKIFHVNWFRKSPVSGTFLWPGYGENIRVLDWIFRRVNGEAEATPSAVGYLPSKDSLNLQGLQDVNLNDLLSLDQQFWEREAEEVRKYLMMEVNEDLPAQVVQQLDLLDQRVKLMSPLKGQTREASRAGQNL